MCIAVQLNLVPNQFIVFVLVDIKSSIILLWDNFTISRLKRPFHGYEIKSSCSFNLILTFVYHPLILYLNTMLTLHCDSLGIYH